MSVLCCLSWLHKVCFPKTRHPWMCDTWFTTPSWRKIWPVDEWMHGWGLLKCTRVNVTWSRMCCRWSFCLPVDLCLSHTLGIKSLIFSSGIPVLWLYFGSKFWFSDRAGALCHLGHKSWYHIEEITGRWRKRVEPSPALLMKWEPAPSFLHTRHFRRVRKTAKSDY